MIGLPIEAIAVGAGLTAAVVTQLQGTVQSLEALGPVPMPQINLPARFPSLPALPRDPVQQAYGWLREATYNLTDGLFRWLILPSQGVIGSAYPGLSGTPLIEVSISPRANFYNIRGKYWKRDYSGALQYQIGEPWAQAPDHTLSSQDNYRPASPSLYETNKQTINGNEVYDLHVQMDVTTWKGEARRYHKIFQQIERLDGLRVWPTEAQAPDWSTTSNGTWPAPSEQKLPARTAALAPPAPLLFVPPAAIPVPEAPSLPGVEVGTGTATKPKAPPIPVSIPIPVPPPEVDREVDRDGKLKPLPRSQPQTTDPDTHWLNGQPITDRGVRPDLTSIAKEVGRIESKTARMLDPGQALPGSKGLIGDLGDILDLAEKIQDVITQDAPGRTVKLIATCDKDSSGDPLRFEESIPGGDYQEAILARLDALIDAFVATKAWRIPICKGKVINNVTITAYNVEPTQPTI